MPQDPDNAPEQHPDPEIGRLTMRALLDAERDRLMREHAERERRARREAQDERVKALRKEREGRARQVHARRLKAMGEATERMGVHVGTASRSLRAALREISAVSAPRHSAEGQEQQRLIRALRASLGALRRAGAREFHETDIDLGAEIDAL